MIESHAPSRKWQFGLRSLMLFMAVLGPLLGGLGMFATPAWEQHQSRSLAPRPV